MKKKLLFASCLAALALTGCNREDFSDENQKGGDDFGYVAVNIVQPQSVSTRAADDGFEKGSDDENFAQDAIFYIFKDNNELYSQSNRISLAGKGSDVTDDNPPAVEKIYKAVFVINESTTNPVAEAKKLVCVLNAPADIESKKISKLSDLQNLIGNYLEGKAKETEDTDKKTFIMTNSVFTQNTDKTGIIYTDIDASKVKNNPDEATGDPMDIYVERVVAKVVAEVNPEFTSDIVEEVVDKKTQKQYSINITGIEVANIADKSYLFKNINNITYDWAWDNTNKRSYWEIVPSTDATDEENKLGFINKSYSEITKTWPITNIKNLTGDNKFFTYIQPNTTNHPDDKYKDKTSILVTAQLYEKGMTNPISNLVYLKGFYYTEDKAKEEIIKWLKENYANYSIKGDDGNDRNFTTNDFVWTHNLNYQDDNNDKVKHNKITYLKNYEVVAQVAYDKISKITKTTATAADGLDAGKSAGEELNELLRGASDQNPYFKARVYNEGRCYYFINIDHSTIAGTGVAAHTYDGVVRNHIYKLKLNSIGGPGVPIYYPDEPIIPEKPNEDLYYLSAQINVLDWKVVNQTIDF